MSSLCYVHYSDTFCMCFSNTLRGVVQDQINYYMVLPNKIPIQLTDTVSIASLKYPVPQVCTCTYSVVL